jgi:hypothetical protein
MEENWVRGWRQGPRAAIIIYGGVGAFYNAICIVRRNSIGNVSDFPDRGLRNVAGGVHGVGRHWGPRPAGLLADQIPGAGGQLGGQPPLHELTERAVRRRAAFIECLCLDGANARVTMNYVATNIRYILTPIGPALCLIAL